MKKILIASILSCIILTTMAQVGINNPTPDPSAVLDLSGGSNSNKGLLLSTTTNVVGVPTPARGLIVMDSATNEIYVYKGDSSKWYSANPWLKEYGVGQVYTNHILTVQNKITSTGPLQIDPDGLAFLAGNGNKIVGGITFSGDAINGGEILADTTLGQEAYFYGNGAVPPGAIMMWSGAVNEIPDGWTICDGLPYYANGNACCDPCTPIQRVSCMSDPNVIMSPDLQGKFVVGYDATDPDYDQINTDQGGGKEVTLTAAESGMPNHNHSVSVSTTGAQQRIYPSYSYTGSTFLSNGSDLGNRTDNVSLSLTSTVSENSSVAQDASQPHENRPPYYTIAYIIKLKFP